MKARVLAWQAKLLISVCVQKTNRSLFLWITQKTVTGIPQGEYPQTQTPAKQILFSRDPFPPTPSGMRLAAYQPDIAPNLGSMIRLSACLNTPLDIIEPCGFPLSIKSLKRSAMDYADIADLTRHNSWEDFAAQNTGRLVLLTTKADQTLWDFEFRPTDTLLMGRESAGVPQNVHDRCDNHVKLPMFGPARSLNVAMCAGMALSEALRQTRSF